MSARISLLELRAVPVKSAFELKPTSAYPTFSFSKYSTMSTEAHSAMDFAVPAVTSTKNGLLSEFDSYMRSGMRNSSQTAKNSSSVLSPKKSLLSF